MTHDWMLGVLTDLEAYARSQDLETIAAALQKARQTAVVDLSLRRMTDAPGGVGGNESSTRVHAGETGSLI